MRQIADYFLYNQNKWNKYLDSKLSRHKGYFKAITRFENSMHYLLCDQWIKDIFRSGYIKLNWCNRSVNYLKQSSMILHNENRNIEQCIFGIINRS